MLNTKMMKRRATTQNKNKEPKRKMKHDRKKIKQNGIEKRTTNTKKYTFNIINLTSVTRKINVKLFTMTFS